LIECGKHLIPLKIIEFVMKQFCVGVLVTSSIFLSVCSMSRAEVLPDSSKLILMEKSAEQGDVLTQLLLGMSYELGKGVFQDYAQAAYWYQKAAEQGNTEAQRILGTMYYNGKGVQKDYIKAAYW